MSFFSNLFSSLKKRGRQLTGTNVLLQANQFLRYRADSKEKMDAQIIFTEAQLSRNGSPSVRLVSFRSIDPDTEFPWLLLKAGTDLALHSYAGPNGYSDKVFASLFGDQPRSITWADHIAENCPRPGNFITELGRQTYEMLVRDIQAGRYVIDRVVRV